MWSRGRNKLHEVKSPQICREDGEPRAVRQQLREVQGQEGSGAEISVSSASQKSWAGQGGEHCDFKEKLITRSN